MNEDRLLRVLELPVAERNQIEGLQTGRAHVHGETHAATRARQGVELSAEQLSSVAIVRLAANPPPAVGVMQRRTAHKLLRPYPLGLVSHARSSTSFHHDRLPSLKHRVAISLTCAACDSGSAFRGAT